MASSRRCAPAAKQTRFSSRPCTPLGTSAFSLVELLVVIAILGVLISLLLPAVQQAREASRVLQCRNHVRQVALAVIEFEENRGQLPAAGQYLPKEQTLHFSYDYWRIDLRQGPLQSWLVSLLPFLEQQALFQQFDFSRHVADNPAQPQTAQPPSLLCPSDQATGRIFEYHDDSHPDGVRFAKANIAAFANPYHVDAWDYPGAIWLYGLTLAQVTDGTSGTLLLGEIRTREHPRDHRGAWALPWSGATLLSVDMHPKTIPQESEQTEANSAYEFSELSFGYTQVPNAKTPDVLYVCPDEEGAQLEAMPCNSSYFGYISAAPRSMHPQGANVAYLDGHATFLTDNVDEVAMAYQASIDDDKYYQGD